MQFRLCEEPQCATAGRKQWNNAPNQTEQSILERWRCPVLTSASFVLEMFSLLQVFTANTCSIRYLKPALTIFSNASCAPKQSGHIYYKQEGRAGCTNTLNVTHQRDWKWKPETHKYHVHCYFFNSNLLFPTVKCLGLNFILGRWVVKGWVEVLRGCCSCWCGIMSPTFKVFWLGLQLIAEFNYFMSSMFLSV